MDSSSLRFQTKMTDDEKLKLYEELVRCRRALSDCRLLRPAQAQHSTNFLKQSIRRSVLKGRKKYLKNAVI
jgi:uncharacterized protein (DUF2236 family)